MPQSIDPQIAIAQRFADAITQAVGPEHAGTDPIIRAANPRFGDYQANVAMSLAKKVAANPRELAEKLVAALDWQDLCSEQPGVAGPGFINLRLKADVLNAAADALAKDQRLGIAPAESPATVVVDYSSPNVAKEMHVGHLRSTVIGDALARMFDQLGHHVIRQNHIGDWGTQFGMLIENLVEIIPDEEIMSMSFDIGDLNAFYKQAKQKFDSDPAFATRSRERVVKLQSGDADTYELWRTLTVKSLEYFDAVYHQLGVTLSTCDEEDVVRGESFYNSMLTDVVAALEAKGILEASDGAKCVFVPGYEDAEGKPVPLIVQKADGGFGYAATDLAAVRYRREELNAARIAYVVDARQGDHFKQVFWVAGQMGWLDDNHAAEHVKFGTILGEDGKPFKTRSGDTVKLVDLLDEAEQRAAAIIASKNPDLDDDERANVAKVIGIGAVKYGDLSGDRVKDYTFSWDRMLAFEGNTAPYLVYGYVRIRSIFRKAGVESSAAPVIVTEAAERALVLKLVQFGAALSGAAEALEPHRLCTYLYELTTAFHHFFEHCPVLRADSEQQKASRLTLCDVTARTLRCGLNLLGIETVERM